MVNKLIKKVALLALSVMFVVAALLLVMGFFFSCKKVQASTLAASGSCGCQSDPDSVVWTLDDQGTLKLSGSGPTDSYRSPVLQGSDMIFYVPWGEYVSDIKRVVINEGITSLGKCLFERHTSIIEVSIPSTVTEIEDKAFVNCSSLTQVVLPSGLKSLGEAAFYGSALETITIPSGMTTIPKNAFGQCQSLTRAYLPETVTEIGEQAFHKCTSLPWIRLPSSLKVLEGKAFLGCKNLYSITIPSKVTSIGEYAFFGTSLSGKLVIPDNVTQIGAYAFRNLKSLDTVKLSKRLQTIGEGAFYGCSGLSTIVIPDSVTEIKDFAFWQCSKLNTITLSSNLSAIGKEAFAYSPVEDLVIPDSVTKIGQNIFESCGSLVSVVLSQNIKVIPSGAFKDCSSLRSVEIPDGVTTIEESAFSGCAQLSRIVLLGGPGEIMDPNAFSSVSAEIYYPEGKMWEMPEIPENMDDIHLTWISFSGRYTVKYKSSEEEPEVLCKKIFGGEEEIIEDLKVQKPYYDFLGWSRSETATAAQYHAGDRITVSEDIVLYAVWKKIDLPPEVTNLKAEPAGKGRVTITWTASSGAEGYLIYAQKNNVYAFVGMTFTGTKYTDINALFDDYNYYWVFPYVKDDMGNKIIRDTDTYVYAKGILPAVNGLKASSTASGVKLTWSAVTGADGYLVYGIVDGKPYGYVGMTTKGTTFTDKTASKTQYNYYWVFPYFKDSNGKMIVGQTGKHTYGRALP